jgi:hypothetical protein
MRAVPGGGDDRAVVVRSLPIGRLCCCNTFRLTALWGLIQLLSRPPEVGPRPGLLFGPVAGRIATSKVVIMSAPNTDREGHHNALATANPKPRLNSVARLRGLRADQRPTRPNDMISFDIWYRPRMKPVLDLIYFDIRYRPRMKPVSDLIYFDIRY